MAFLFGGGRPVKPAPDPVREHRLELQRGTRAMDREDLKASRSEAVLKREIETHARLQRYDACQDKARELIRLRAHRARLSNIKGHMHSLDRQLATVQGGKQIQSVVLKTTQIMRNMNRTLDPRRVHHMLHEFERHSTALSMGQEIVEETLDSVFEVEGEGDATDDAMVAVFAELGLDQRVVSRARGEPLAPPVEADMETRLARLRAI
jgi:division protein CdvB (Snf7/Vps24/ESCRT-III family)